MNNNNTNNDNDLQPPRLLARRNTEDHLNDALNEALEENNLLAPRLLARQQSSFLNEELDNFFVSDDDIGSNVSGRDAFLSPKLERNNSTSNNNGSTIQANNNKNISSSGTFANPNIGHSSTKNLLSKVQAPPISRQDSILLETFLDEFYQTNIDTIPEEERINDNDIRDGNRSQFFSNTPISKESSETEILVYEYDCNTSHINEMLLPSTITQIETTGDRTVALTSSGQLYGWGDNFMNCLCMDKDSDQSSSSRSIGGRKKELLDYELKLYTYIIFNIYTSKSKLNKIDYNGFANMLHSLYGVDVGVDLLIKMNNRNMEKYKLLCKLANVAEEEGLTFEQFFELHEKLSLVRVKHQLNTIILKNKAHVIDLIFDSSDEDKDGFINLKEMQLLAKRTNGSVPELAWSGMCHAVRADPAKGFQRNHLKLLYQNRRHAATLDEDYIYVQKYEFGKIYPRPVIPSINNDDGSQKDVENRMIEEEQRVLYVPKPSLIESLVAVRISQVSCGYNHTAVLTTTNVVLTFGSNEFGQLAHGKENNRKELIEDGDEGMDDTYEIYHPYKVMIKQHAGQPVQIKCGNNFTILLTNLGQVWSAGKYYGGALGLGDKKRRNRFKMEHVSGLTMYAVVDIDVGKYHVVATTLKNGCFTWGSNSHGQLGLTQEHSLSNLTYKSYPCLLKRFKLELEKLADKVVVVSAGSYHSCFVTERGKLYGCGSNIYSQLALSNSVGKFQQCLKVPTLLNLDALDKSNDSNDSTLKFTHVTCNNKESIVATESGNVYCLGVDNGKLKIKGNVAEIAAGGDKKYIICHPSSQNSAKSILGLFSGDTTDARTNNKPVNRAKRSDSMIPKRKLVQALNLSYFRIVARNCSRSNSFEAAIQQMLELFSNPAALNVCFINRKSTINYSDIKELYETYSKNIEIENTIYNATHNGLLRIEDVINNANKLQEVRCIVILLLNPLYMNRTVGNKWSNQYLKICHLFVKMKPLALKVLAESFIQNIPKDIVEVQIKQLVWLFSNEMKIQGRSAVDKDGVALGIVEFLSCLHKAKSSIDDANDGAMIEDHIFYTDFTAKLSYQYFAKDYWSWVTDEQGHGSTFTFCKYSFLLNPNVKRRILFVESNLRMHDAMQNAMVRSMRNMQLETKFLGIQIRRSHIMEDSISIAGKLRDEDLRKPLKVKFYREDGVDAGGVKREYFSLLTEKLFDPNFGHWKVVGDDSCFWFTSVGKIDSEDENLNEVEGKDVYYLVGLLAGLAVYNSVILDLHFPQIVYKKLLGFDDFSLHDLKTIDKFIYSGLKQLRDYDGDDVEDIFCLCFEVTYKTNLGVEVKHDLIENGANISVTSDNKHEYIDKYVQFILHDSIKDQFEHFATGFLKVVDGKALHLFTPKELEGLVEGEIELDFKQLEEHSTYEGGFSKEHPYIKKLWEVLHNFDFEQKKKFLRFCTGADRAPIGGLKNLEPKFKIQRNGPDKVSLPTSATCFNTLLLPEYDSKLKLKRLLLVAIENASGFGLQ